MGFSSKSSHLQIIQSGNDNHDGWKEKEGNTYIFASAILSTNSLSPSAT